MDKSRSKDRLLHIKNAIALIKSYVATQTEHDFTNDVKTQNAVLYQFLIIGEAVRHIDNTILEKYKYPLSLKQLWKKEN